MSLQTVFIAWVVAASILATPLAAAGSSRARTFHRTWRFRADAAGWTHGFADYPVGQEAFYALQCQRRPLPSPPGKRFGMYLSGNNHSDDLFMFIKAPVDGLRPDALYDVRFRIRLLSNAPAGAVGAGGAPGEGVSFKGGSSSVEPAAVPVDGSYRMNVDVGIQSNDGANAVVLGNIAVATDVETPAYRKKALRSPRNRRLRTRADSSGRLWVLLGTDSGFEGTTSVYVARVKVTLRRIAADAGR